MSAAGYGGLTAIVLIVAVGAANAIDTSSNYKPATATVYRIDRSCSFTQVYKGGEGKREVHGVEQDCSVTDEFKKIARAPKRPMDVDGKAVVKVSFTAPQDGTSQTGELEFDGRDDQFYSLKSGDQLRILVANNDLTKIRPD